MPCQAEGKWEREILAFGKTVGDKGPKAAGFISSSACGITCFDMEFRDLKKKISDGNQCSLATVQKQSSLCSFAFVRSRICLTAVTHFILSLSRGSSKQGAWEGALACPCVMVSNPAFLMSGRYWRDRVCRDKAGGWCCAI